MAPSTAKKHADPARLVAQVPRLVTPKPLLASEVLRDEIAPLEPGAKGVRFWLLGIAAALVLLGLALRGGLGGAAHTGDAATLAFSSAGALCALAALPFPYAVRAAVTLLVGTALLALGLRGAGPLAALKLAGSGPQEVSRAVAVTLLPACLLFRAHYREYRTARLLLAGAIVASLPFATFPIGILASEGASVVSRLFAGACLIALLGSLFGFMSEGATAGAVGAAVGVLSGLPLQIAASPHAPEEQLLFPLTAFGAVAAALLASVGLFQLLAAGLGGRARHAAGGSAQSASERT